MHELSFHLFCFITDRRIGIVSEEAEEKTQEKKEEEEKGVEEEVELVSWLVLWAQSTTKDYIRAEH